LTGPIEVHVEIDGRTRRAGTLHSHRRRSTESATFVYDDAYLGEPGSYALDPGLPLTGGQHQTRVGQALFGAFSDSAPDRWGRTLIHRAEQRKARADGVATRSLGEVDYLVGVRDDLRQGALRFRSVENGPFLAEDDVGVPAVTQLPDLLELAARAEADTASYDELRRLVRAGSSLGGARPKAHVAGTDGRVAIAKFPSASTDSWNVMAWEKVAHDLARAAGVVVPDSELIRIDGRSVHIIDRFDRLGEERIGYTSAMTMLEAADGDQRSYLEIASAIEERSPATTRDLHQLWRRIAFFVLISNTDDHLRNHAFLHVRADAWTLSPAFDLNPNPDSRPKDLTTAIDATDTAATIANVRGVAEYFRLGSAQAQAVLTEVAEAVRGWRTTAREHGLSDREIDDMAPAFDHAEAAAALE